MSWSKLNPHELQAMRKLLMLDVREAAEMIGRVSVRAWQYWEAGGRPIPDDVDMEIYALVQQRGNLIEEMLELAEPVKLRYYHSFDDWLADGREDNKAQWKLHQSAVAYVFAEGGDVELTD